MIDPARFPDLLEEVGALAHQAGDAILDTVASLGEVEEKEDGSPVTRADRAANDVLVEGLQALDPSLPIISEEGDLDESVRASGSVFWLVDPLDGTKEFIAGRPEYTVNVALVEDCVPVLGVIQVPVSKRLYLGARDHGARRFEGEDNVLLVPRTCVRPERAVVSRSHLNQPTEDFLEHMGIRETTPCGSSLKICAVAEGVADVYPRFGPTSLWDTAAGAAIATAAGCDVVDLKGRPLRYDPAGGLLHAGFLVAAPGGCLEACLPALESLD